MGPCTPLPISVGTAWEGWEVFRDAMRIPSSEAALARFRVRVLGALRPEARESNAMAPRDRVGEGLFVGTMGRRPCAIGIGGFPRQCETGEVYGKPFPAQPGGRHAASL